jgi:hypothetical protein
VTGRYVDPNVCTNYTRVIPPLTRVCRATAQTAPGTWPTPDLPGVDMPDSIAPPCDTPTRPSGGAR